MKEHWYEPKGRKHSEICGELNILNQDDESTSVIYRKEVNDLILRTNEVTLVHM
jgi:hypothetical protein